MNLIRLFDIVFAIIGLVIFSPLFIFLALCIKLTSKGGVFFRQVRVGKNNCDFKLFKFRSMYANAEAKGQLTVGGNDNRITPIGYFIRKFKLDELPQFINVLVGDMSFVGPRPEVRKYVNHYTQQQMQILNVLPGITDYASIEFRNENELLASVPNAEEYYIQHIMPKKISLNHKFINNKSLKTYFHILFLTFFTAIKGK